ncbi:MAG TPA: GDP-L-fucose synthase [Methylomusa anaerophila]|uniref:GDP-L-fucose synthase n=1 Tax=Methylomusa anaerophila TaxID=1930071 RepID=A0A348AKM0_9FIRM|nr:GDP-L-fucose synthase [Methylomusa anaerophila]BBB91618.1 GDP-L-fucose synthase [Methylomusa anaerophila]HML89444.1 GDP-L-fucose synthase [Methylomusa anaerophila]
MEHNERIYVAGHQGMVGSAIVRQLQKAGYEQLIMRTSRELDLRSQKAVDQFFADQKPDYVIVAAAKVGGIGANSTYPAEFIYDNIMIEANLIHAAHQWRVKKLLFLGSSCIYPKFCPQPIKEEYLLSGFLESTNEAYAIAKIAGIKLCQYYKQQYGDNFISVMPTNLYGINDNFDLETSHVLPALIRKFHDAKETGADKVIVWGTGKPRREFLYVDDLAEACCFLMQNYESNHIINIGTGKDLPIRELAEMIREIVGFAGDIVYDATKPDGTPVKLLDVSRINQLGWQAKTPLRAGIEKTYTWYTRSDVCY